MQNKFKRLSAAIPAFMLMLGGAVPTQAQMFAPGEFAVNKNGAATYTMPIIVPAGVGGMQPKLALAYSSQAGNGLIGPGWTLAGLSGITRCPQTRAQDDPRSWVGGINYKATDRFCLDGQRLMNVSKPSVSGILSEDIGTYGADQTYYSPEVATFSRIQSFGSKGTAPYAGPSYFIVKTKSGLTMEYGNTVDSKVLAVGKDAVRLWALNKVMDAKGNFMTVTYNAPDPVGGQHYPLRIDYAGNDGVTPKLTPARTVTFEYDPDPANGGKPKQRLDGDRFYRGGSVETVGVRLTKIVIGRAGVADNYYKVDYSPLPVGKPPGSWSGVERVTRCNAGNQCLGSTNFGLPQVGSPSQVRPVSFNFPKLGGSAFVSNVLRASNGTADIALGDFNGDGRMDILAWNDDFTKNKLFSGGGVFEEQTSFNIKNELLGHSNGTTGVEVADFNRDGRADILRWSTHAADNAVFISEGDGSFIKLPFGLAGVELRSGRYALSPDTTLKRDTDFSLGDFDGDGRMDIIVWKNDRATPLNGTTTVYFSTAEPVNLALFNLSGYTGRVVRGPVLSGAMHQRGCFRHSDRQVADFNGDGRADVMVVCGATGLYQANGTGVFASFEWTNLDARLLVNDSPDSRVAYFLADLNGDGLSDVIRDGVGYLQTGDGGFVSAGSQVYASSTNASWTQSLVDIPIDPVRWDADIAFMKAHGKGIVMQTAHYVTQSSATGFVAGDFNGDGLVDFYLWKKSMSAGMLPYSCENSFNLSRVTLVNGLYEYGTAVPGNYDATFFCINGDAHDERVYAADFDGDGKTDLLRLGDDKTRNLLALSISTNQQIGAVGRIWNMDEIEHKAASIFSSIIYAPLNTSGRYTKTAGVGGEYSIVPLTMSVVKDVQQGPRGMAARKTSYFYDSAIVNHAGRGWQGFSWVKKQDVESGLTEINYYSPYFPGVGQHTGVARTTNAFAEDIDLGQDIFAYDWSLLTPKGFSSPIYYLSRKSKYSYSKRDVTALGGAGAALPGGYSQTWMDTWGNETKSTVDTYDPLGHPSGHLTTTTNEYAPADTVNWVLGRLLKSTTTVTAP